MALLPAERKIDSLGILLEYAHLHRRRPLRGVLFRYDEGELCDEIKGIFVREDSADEPTVRFEPNADEHYHPIAITRDNFVKDSIFVQSRHEISEI